MIVDYETMIRELSQIIWPIGRLSGLIATVPVLSSNLMPSRIKLIFIVTVSWFCSYFVSPDLSFSNFTGIYLVYIVNEFFLGVLMGFVLQLVFQIFILAGQIVSFQAGLGFAVMVDPASKASVPLISQFYTMLTSLIFLSLNGHLAILDALMQSFNSMPIGSVSVDNTMLWNIITFSAWMFNESVLISIPAILSLLIVSLAFGIATRVTPQLNIFSLGFPITLLMAFVVIKMGLPSVGEEIVACIEHGMHFIIGMIR